MAIETCKGEDDQGELITFAFGRRKRFAKLYKGELNS
jgi:hypothetical protein